MSEFYNLKIQKVYVIVEGKPNQLYAQGMSNMMRSGNISLKESKRMRMLMGFRNNYNYMI